MGTPVKLGLARNTAFVFSELSPKTLQFLRPELIGSLRGRIDPLKLDAVSYRDARVLLRACMWVKEG